MLVSQLMLHKPNKFNYNHLKGIFDLKPFDKDLAITRNEVAKAKKYVIPLNILNLNQLPGKDESDDESWAATESAKPPAEKEVASYNIDIMLDDSMFIENQSGGILIKNIPGRSDCYIFQSFLIDDKTGDIWSTTAGDIIIYPYDLNEKNHPKWERIETAATKQIKMGPDINQVDRLRSTLNIQIKMAFLIIDQFKDKIKTYYPSNRELGKSAASIRRYYKYNVLDLNDYKETIETLNDVEYISSMDHLMKLKDEGKLKFPQYIAPTQKVINGSAKLCRPYVRFLKYSPPV